MSDTKIIKNTRNTQVLEIRISNLIPPYGVCLANLNKANIFNDSSLSVSQKQINR